MESVNPIHKINKQITPVIIGTDTNESSRNTTPDDLQDSIMLIDADSLRSAMEPNSKISPTIHKIYTHDVHTVNLHENDVQNEKQTLANTSEDKPIDVKINITDNIIDVNQQIQLKILVEQNHLLTKQVESVSNKLDTLVETITKQKDNIIMLISLFAVVEVIEFAALFI